MSVHVVSSAPPPTAYPSMADTERMGREWSRLVTFVMWCIMAGPSLSD
eukprot:CAMPEP_0201649136 /NCGR_PEP_ID=MMETSP0493-20130528/38845_1 /ASSEMBLY_ACC=CAM_ASM_000838 /TAXON_ID=420259 /ORGANISM="Thalassiosira gravida, Strain GMp14c1" /LENGTH=47 /DNA_ID= /DNA_START= /DNA_END= /DNA_ORIENTATION=